MSENELKCPRCGGDMDLGLVVDRGDYSIPEVANWVEGMPERSLWSGLKTKGRETYPVRSYRCEKCGYLESYARPATDH
jgi:ribosomal protein L37E